MYQVSSNVRGFFILSVNIEYKYFLENVEIFCDSYDSIISVLKYTKNIQNIQNQYKEYAQ